MARSSSTARSLVTPTNAITLGKITPPLTSVNPVAISSPIDDSSACTLDGLDADEIDCMFPDNRSSDTKKIKFISYPYHLWGLSALLLTGASFFVYALTSATVYRIEKGYWWQYGFAVVMYALGIICIFVGEVEVFRMDRGKGTVSISKRRCYTHIIRHSCVAVYTIENGLTIAIMSSSIKYETRLLQDVVRVSVECSGEKVGEVDTRFYKIHIDYSDGTSSSALEHRSKNLTIRRCQSLNYFLDTCRMQSASVTQAASGSRYDKAIDEEKAKVDQLIHEHSFNM